MNNPLVTIVIPVYNVEKYLDRCVESIVNQTYKKLEIILVDDGSPDSCPQMCDDWAKKDIRIKVIHKENAGLGMARNSGLEIATGSYILFVDSDDYIAYETVEKCVTEFIKNHSDVIMFGRFDLFRDGRVKEKPVVTDDYVFCNEKVINDILPGLFTYKRGTGISSCCKMYNLQLIKYADIKYKSEREILSEDALFNLELFPYVKTVSIIPESFYYYFKNENSLSRSYKKNLPQLNNNFLEGCLHICEQNGYNKQIKDCIRARYHIYAFDGMKQIQANNFSKEEKKNLLNKFFNDELLHKSITFKTLKPKSIPLKIFFLCIRFRMYWICRILLKFAH